jgi:putative acetyltransferase
MTREKIEITRATVPGQIAEARALFLEYAQSLEFNFCFQSFEKELAELPGMYGPPRGALLLATVNDQAAGCCGLQNLEGHRCEMKRLYVRPHFRGVGLGGELVKRIIAEAVRLGYEEMRLETIEGKMDAAIELYRRFGFEQITPDRRYAGPGALYMSLELRHRLLK